jgi:hypothetical protein
MAQVLTLVSVLALAAYLMWRFALVDRLLRRRTLRVTLRLDRDSPGAHLIWHLRNAAPDPVVVTALVTKGRQGTQRIAAPDLPARLAPEATLIIFTDADWSLLGAKSVAVVDANGCCYRPLHRELAAIQDRVRQLIDRRISTTSARDFLSGAADLAFGVVILGLGFFMLMWVIATG